MAATRSASLNGSGRNSTLLTIVNIAVAAPIPSASVAMAVNEKPGARARTRSAWRVLRNIVVIIGCLSSVETQNRQRVGTSRAARGKVHGHECHGAEHERDCRE